MEWFSKICMNFCIEKEIRTKNVTTVLRVGRSQYNEVKFNLVTVVEEGRAAIWKQSTRMALKEKKFIGAQSISITLDSIS